MTSTLPSLNCHAASADDQSDRLVAELRADDPPLTGHAHRVADLAGLLGARLALPGPCMGRLRRSALLHDAGKHYIPRHLLAKPGPLAPHEFHVIEAHSTFGQRILLEAGLLAEAAIVRHHHERWDGAGYPDRLAGELIPIESRIIFVADAFDAMTSERPYRSARAADEAVAEVERCAGSQFDPAVALELRAVVAL